VKGQGAATYQKYTVPKPDLDWDAGGFFSLTTYDAEGWIVEENFYIYHKRMQDDGDTYSMYLAPLPYDCFPWKQTFNYFC
jgi:hypothetical protein